MDTNKLSDSEKDTTQSQRSSEVEQFFRKEEVVGPTPTVGSENTTNPETSMARSRVNKTLEREAKRNLFLAITGIIFIIVLLLVFGVPLFIKFSDFVGQTKDDGTNTADNNAPSIIAPPTLDQTFEATNSAEINVTGSAVGKQNITLYVNDEIADKEESKDDGSFEFKNVELNEGENTITARATSDSGKKSNLSPEIQITYLKNPPSLTIDSPEDGHAFAKDERTITVSGKTDKDVKVTVNDYWAVVDDTGHFTYRIQLQDGDNELKVVATDQAGNTKEETRHVTYSP